MPQIRGIVMVSRSTTYESVRNLANRLVKYELNWGIVSTKIETTKPKNDKHKTGGRDFKHTSRKKQRDLICIRNNYDH